MTVDVASRKIDQNVGIFQLARPIAKTDSIPHNHWPRRCVRGSRENGDRVTLGVEMARQDRADLSIASGKDDSQGTMRRHARILQRKAAAYSWRRGRYGAVPLSAWKQRATIQGMEDRRWGII